MRNFNYPSLSELENELLTPAQKGELVKFDNEQKNSYKRWKKRVARRLRDGEVSADFDSVDYMNLPEGIRLTHATNIGGDPEHDDYSEESDA